MQSIRNKVYRAVRSSGYLLKLDTIYLLKGGFWTVLRFIIGTLASVVSMVAFGNLLSKDSYGVYSYLLSLGASLSFLTLSGTGTAAMRAVARGYENVIPAALRFQLKHNLLSVACILAAAIYYSYNDNILFAGSLAFLALAYPIAEAFHMYVPILTGQKRFDTITKLTSLSTLLSTLITITALLLTQNVLILIALYSLTSLIINVSMYKWVTRNLSKALPSEEAVREMKRTSLHVTWAGYVGAAAQHIDKIFIFQVLGPVSLAIYAFALAGPERLKGLVKSFIGIAMPQIARRSLYNIRQVMYSRIALATSMGAILALGYIILSPVLFELLLPKYLEAITYSQILALSLIAIPTSVYIGTVFASQNMLKANYAFSIGTQIIRIALLIPLGLLWELWGIIIAFVLSTALHAVYSIIVWEIEVRRLMKINAK